MNAACESGRERFLRAIAELVPAERVAEVHIFPPMLQGGQETGVAVIAAYPLILEAGPPPESQDTDNVPALHDQSGEPAITSTLDRLVVYRACYRWTRKGPDRGRWEIEVTEEADAPLGAVGNVVRGVYRRAGSGSEPERLPGDAFRAVVSDEPWTPGR
ncbi:MAG: hypothetical protein ACR2G6_08425 [Gemmatimonadaceae bacterium]